MYDKWKRDGELSWAERFWKARQFVTSTAAAPLWTRAADEVGHGVRCIGRPRITNFGTMRLGDAVVLRSVPVSVELVASRGGSLVIGDRTSINAGASIHADRSIRIGADVRIAPYVMIMDTTFHEVSLDRGIRPAGEPVEIEDNVWLAIKATVLPGVHIGRNAVVAAHAVVTRDVPAGTIVAGAPARVVGEVPDGAPHATLAPAGELALVAPLVGAGR